MIEHVKVARVEKVRQVTVIARSLTHGTDKVA
jgi:hypothetical protein